MLLSPALALAIGPIEKPPRILDICISQALTNTLPGAEQMAVVAVGTVCSAHGAVFADAPVDGSG
jgi:hypothetical protein